MYAGRIHNFYVLDSEIRSEEKTIADNTKFVFTWDTFLSSVKEANRKRENTINEYRAERDRIRDDINDLRFALKDSPALTEAFFECNNIPLDLNPAKPERS